MSSHSVNKTPTQTARMLDELGIIGKEVEYAWDALISRHCRPLPRKSRAGAPRLYGLRQIFTAILALVRFAHPLRTPLPNPMPGVHTTFLYLHFWNKTGCLARMWRAYLHSLPMDRIQEWETAFRSPDLAGTVRQHAAWFLGMKEVLHKTIGSRYRVRDWSPEKWRRQ